MFQIEVKTEDVNRFITEALVNSTLGAKFSETINKEINEALHGYNSPIKNLVRDSVVDAVRKTLDSEPWKAKIQEHLAKHLTEDYVSKVMGVALDKALQEMRGNNY